MFRSLFTFLISLLLSCFLTSNAASADDSFDDLFKMPEVKTEAHTVATVPFTSTCAYDAHVKIKCKLNLNAGSYIYKDSVQVVSSNAKAVLSSIPMVLITLILMAIVKLLISLLMLKLLL